MSEHEQVQRRPKVLVVGANSANAAVSAALIAAGMEVVSADGIGSDEPLARLQTLAAAYREPRQRPAFHAAWQGLERRGKKGKQRRW